MAPEVYSQIFNPKRVNWGGSIYSSNGPAPNRSIPKKGEASSPEGTDIRGASTTHTSEGMNLSFSNVGSDLLYFGPLPNVRDVSWKVFRCPINHHQHEINLPPSFACVMRISALVPLQILPLEHSAHDFCAIQG